jgi:NAD(P)-dependent dehydrogenase (short-subunit alcohol dehydrogenase family)
MTSLGGRVALVSGSSRGIGAAIAAEFPRATVPRWRCRIGLLTEDVAGGAVMVRSRVS